MKNVVVIEHPLVQHKLSVMRKKSTSTSKSRTLMREVGMLLGYEATRNMKLCYHTIETPFETMQAPMLEGKKTALISILRAGNGLLDGFLQLLPTAKVGHVGLYRESHAHNVVEYYFKIPEDISSRNAIILDPLLATGQSAVACLARLKPLQPQSVVFVCLLASPEGLRYFQNYYEDVTVYTGAIDRCLNAEQFILPGLGDAGDRLFGTQ